MHVLHVLPVVPVNTKGAYDGVCGKRDYNSTAPAAVLLAGLEPAGINTANRRALAGINSADPGRAQYVACSTRSCIAVCIRRTVKYRNPYLTQM